MMNISAQNYITENRKNYFRNFFRSMESTLKRNKPETEVNIFSNVKKIIMINFECLSFQTTPLIAHVEPQVREQQQIPIQVNISVFHLSYIFN